MIRNTLAVAGSTAAFNAAAHGDHGGIGHFHAGDVLGIAIFAVWVAGAVWLARRR